MVRGKYPLALATESRLQGAGSIPTNLLYLIRQSGAPMVVNISLFEQVLTLCRRGKQADFNNAHNCIKAWRASDPIACTVMTQLVAGYEFDEVIVADFGGCQLVLIGNLDSQFNARRAITVLNQFVGFDAAKRCALPKNPGIVTGGIVDDSGLQAVLRVLANECRTGVSVATTIAELRKAGIGGWAILAGLPLK